MMRIKLKRLIAISIDYVIILITDYYFSTFWLIFSYESIGKKKIMGLKIYDENGKRIKNKKILTDRVYYSLSTFHIYMFMILANNKSTGDKK